MLCAALLGGAGGGWVLNPHFSALCSGGGKPKHQRVHQSADQLLPQDFRGMYRKIYIHYVLRCV